MEKTPQTSSVFVESLSKTQKRKSVGEQAKRDKVASSLSKPKKSVVRSTVLNPIEIEWPFLEESVAQNLQELLRADLQILKGMRTKLSLREIREVPKSERRAFRRKRKTDEAEKVGFDTDIHALIRKCQPLGVNSVSRSMDGNQLAVVIVESEVDPPIMTKLLVSIALNKKVPVIALAGLANLALEVADFLCIAIGVKTDVPSENNPVHKLRNTLIEFANKVKTNTVNATLGSPMPLYKTPKIRRV